MNVDPTILTITGLAIAVLFGPVAAVQVEKYLSRIRENKARRVSLFKTLMATRGDMTSVEHVKALNQIDLEFSGDRKFKKVLDAWQIYFNHLSENTTVYTEEQNINWASKRIDYLIDLLYEMGISLGFDYSKATIKRNSYVPQLYSNIESENAAIRQLLLRLLKGDRSLPVIFTQETIEDDLEEQRQLRKAMLGYYQSQIDENPEI